ncbi:tRNA adenosine(34) deaminase TadA [Salibacterium sp. K-3]
MVAEEEWMKAALAEAEKAEAAGEVPIGCVIVYKDKIIGTGYNQREGSQQASAHAEMLAIREACSFMGSWRLEDCALYVTLEPCPMCAGAIVQSRIPHVVYGAPDPKAGCAGTLMNLLDEERFNHRCTVRCSLMLEECRQLLTHFFQHLRKEKQRQKERGKEVEE